VHSRGNGKSFPRRDFLSDRHQCRRSKLGFGPIRIRIVYNNQEPVLETYSDIKGKENISPKVTSTERKLVTKKRNIAKKVVASLEISKRAKVVSKLEREIQKQNENIRKDNYAKQIRERLVSSIIVNKSEEIDKLQIEEINLKSQVRVKELQLKAATCQLNNLTEKIKSTSSALVEYNKELKRKKVLVKYYSNTGNEGVKDTSTDDVAQLCNAIEQAFSFLKGKRACTKAKLLVEAIMSGKLLKGEAAALVNDLMRQYIRSLFRPWKMVKAGDVSSVGGFRTSTINTLRNVIDETGEGLFPSPTTVNRSRALLDEYGKEAVGYHRRETKYGEVYYINFEKAFRLLLKACKLDELAEKESVKVALTVDGADLFKGRTHVSTGIKITDERGVHPITGKPFFLHASDNNDERYVNIQTSEICCVMIIADATDNKHLYQEVFKEYYDWGEKIRMEGLPASPLGPKLMPFKVTHTTDMKAAWYLSNKGGGCKNKNFFCHLCTCTKDSLTSYSIDNDRCNRCKIRNRRKCYHHEVCDSVKVQSMLDNLESSLGEYYEKHGKTYKEIMEKTQLRTDHMQATKESDMRHIDYIIPVNDPEKQRQYSQFIARECFLRGIRLHGTQVDEWRSLLRVSVSMEKYIFFLERVRMWKAEGRESVPLVEVVELLIPCILHLENRIGEKIITIILRKGLDCYQGRKEDYIETMLKIFRTQILGTDTSPSHWRLYYEKDSDGNIRLEPVQVKNNVSRSIINHIDTIIEAAFPPGDAMASSLIIALSKYKEAMGLLTQHRELTEEETDHFQDLIDDFFEAWVDIFGDEGITNYIHMLGSGHILYFMKTYGCLYLYSQQGWESLNSTIQTFIIQNSQRGGHGSGQNKTKSYIFPLVRMIIRDLLWKTYEADKFFIQLEEQGKAC